MTESATLALSTTNAQVRDHIASAMGMVFVMADHGCTVTRVEINHGGPLIWVDPAPSPFVRGALRKRMVVDGLQMTVRIALVRGCHVQWIERHTIQEKSA